MGYKRAGFHVIGNVEIDPRVNAVYAANNRPQYNFCMDLREFNALPDLPPELFKLDILDGSPPCSAFSTAGERESAWGKMKKFREGQKEQTLDDLFFTFLDTAERLKPKIIVAENVTGLLKGNAKGYVNEIIKRFHAAGYEVQLFKLNAATMDVPQARERVFFIANNQRYPKLRLDFHGAPIPFGQVRAEHGKPLTGKAIKTKERLKRLLPSDTCISDILERTEGRKSSFNTKIAHDFRVFETLVSNSYYIRACDLCWTCDSDHIAVSTFPQDYDFGNQSAKYICGMSVPPNMMANIAARIWEQWLAPRTIAE